jgi:TRAP-type C4-dicarboxylate transport system substrate-binding protein
MRQLTRILTGTILALGSTTLFAAEFKIATVAPEGTQWMQEIRAAAADVKSRTQGRVVVKLYGGGVMGNEKQVLRKMRIGQLQGGAFTAGGLAEKYPDIVIYGLPLEFESPDEVAYVRKRMDDKLARGLEQAGFVSFGIAGGGFARIFANKPVVTNADMRGLKIWIPEGDRISAASMEALNLAPVSLPVTDVLTGLQTGLLDVVAAPPVGVIALQWHTRVKYMTSEPLMYTMGLMAVDATAFGKLDAADQTAFRDAMTRVYQKLDQQSEHDDQEARKAIQASGIKVVDASPEAVRSWREAMTVVNRKLGEEGMFTPGLLAEVQGYVKEFRQRPAAAGPARQP